MIAAGLAAFVCVGRRNPVQEVPGDGTIISEPLEADRSERERLVLHVADEEREEREDQYKCVCCGKLFKDTHTKTGEFYTAAQAYHMTEKKYGKAICIDCRKKEGIQS